MAETIIEFIQRVAKSNSSTVQDSIYMCNILRQMGFSKAVVVSGIVYLKGRGTLNAPPTSIHSVAKMIVAGYKKHGVI